MALDQVEVMKHLGFERFALCGHDRGGRVGYRMGLDHPGVVTKLAVLDIVPTSEAFSRADMEFGLSYWHWFFFAQPYDLPERLLAVDPEKSLFRGGSEIFHAAAMEEYVRCLRNPETIHATCEDYRAAATLDFEHDADDRRGGRRISCPVPALWGRQGSLRSSTTCWTSGAGGPRTCAVGCSTAVTTSPRRLRRRPTPSCARSSALDVSCSRWSRL
jgi:haloacetate dehalogenase